MAMHTDESMTESNPPAAPVPTHNLIVATGSPGAVIEPTPEPNGGAHPSEAAGPGIEGEETVWEGHYSFKNFVGRIILAVVFTLLWLWLALDTWGLGHASWAFWTILLGLGLLAFWANLGYKYLRAHRGHHYR